MCLRELSFNVARVLGWCLAGGFLKWLCEIGITSATTCFRAQSVARESNSERELARKVQWTFRASSAEWRLAMRTALRSYTLFGLSGCVVKFSFLLTFSAKIVFVNKIITIVPLLYCSTSNSYLPYVNSNHSCFWYGRSAWYGVCSSNGASVL